VLKHIFAHLLSLLTAIDVACCGGVLLEDLVKSLSKLVLQLSERGGFRLMGSAPGHGLRLLFVVYGCKLEEVVRGGLTDFLT
jgi:hypothetical protein